MVLSTTKKTASIASISNQNQGGGAKKAGLTPLIGKDAWTHSAYRSVGAYCCLDNLKINRFKVFPNQNLPVGFRSSIRIH